ncbi:hypothetical protein [Cohnella abietis]|uniref:Uncharacterized protein n=1 Tax=Cohnella abietis TaxID=2507935 RepID=A0A3T1D2T7_9BACL|nr:hypothetical protein [Cohnella abietis]BBI32339.1 hypothetical protein KCTCHS21_17380 [Cohnella abietis]
MGEARRRKLAGNTEPNKQWHQRKAIDRYAHKVAVQERAEARAKNAMRK